MISLPYHNTTYRPAAYYIAMLVISSLVLQLLSSILVSILTVPFIASETLMMALSQAVISTFTYVLPPLYVESYYRRKSGTWVYKSSAHSATPKVIYSFVLFILSYGVMLYMGGLNEQIGYPTCLGQIGEDLQRLDLRLNESLQSMISDSNPLTIAFTFLSIVIIAPIGEELFFRGALLGWLIGRLRGAHWAIFLSALIFSAIHLQWIGFLPRLMMGILLGYTAVYGSLKMAILLHLLNNLMAYIQAVTIGNVNESPDLLSQYPIASTITAALCLVLSVIVLRKMISLNRIHSSQ